MKKLYLDTETTGLCGPVVIVQYAEEDGPINIFNFWKNSVGAGLELIEWICQHAVIGFNLSFDWFQLQKMYNMLSLIEDKRIWPEDIIDELGMKEAEARDGLCIKPASACDLMLIARKTKYQITMNRGDIVIRRVPTALAFQLAQELEQRIILKGILFARRKDKYAPRWTVTDCVNRDTNKIDPNFKNVNLKFKPSVALKALAIDALGIPPEEILLFTDVEVDKKYHPIENKFAPFATSISTDKRKWYGHTLIGKKKKKGFAWPAVIHHHIDHWEYNRDARLYANKDVDYTRRLYHHFDCPELGDDDSILACSVGSVRWKGYTFDIDGVKQLKAEAESKLGKYPASSTRKVRALLESKMSDVEKMCLKNTSRVMLEEIAKWKNLPCPFCNNHPREVANCVACEGKGKYNHPASEDAQGVLETRFAAKEIELYDKIILAGRFHTSFKVIGALSSRMAGADGLNPQGINKAKRVRSKFTFGEDQFPLYGGDFDAFEVGLADAAYPDPVLHADLQTKAMCPGCLGKREKKGIACDDCKGTGQTNKKIHALFAMQLVPGMTYEQIVASKGQNPDYYDLGKRGVFSQIYLGNEITLVKKLGIGLEEALRAHQGFFRRYHVMRKQMQDVIDRFQSMKQPEGIGKKIYWAEPADFSTSLFGFKRYFTLENEICKHLFQLAQKLPEAFKECKIKVMRRDREQFAAGAVMSALYGAAFQIQASNTRAAANHVIQSSGAQITKYVQRRIWDHQPVGVHKWMVQPCNIHDEILCPLHPSIADAVKATVDKSVAAFRNRVPLIEMEWKRLKNWAEK